MYYLLILTCVHALRVENDIKHYDELQFLSSPDSTCIIFIFIIMISSIIIKIINDLFSFIIN